MEASASESGLFRRFLEKRGLRVTTTRMAIAGIVFATHQHFTPDQLAEWVRKRDPTTGRMTVYRTLGLLVESELVESLTLGKGRNYYEHTVGHGHHHHMICLRCGRIQEFSHPLLDQLPRRIARERGFAATSHSIRIHGVCADCGAGGGRKRRRNPGPGHQEKTPVTES
ncbi:MAG: transcriptional repressor [Planctomycetes bacterium]|nr:transcriptional repressor [Planctomycetota bacterium]